MLRPLLTVVVLILALLAVSNRFANASTIITFDEYGATGGDTSMVDGYAGLHWGPGQVIRDTNAFGGIFNRGARGPD
jgi:hypothetical protein